MSDRTDYVRGQLAFLRDVLPKVDRFGQRVTVTRVVLGLIVRRLISRAGSQVEWDAAEAANCPCEEDMPAAFRCHGCPRRLLG